MIDLTDLSLTREGRRILDRFSLHIASGERVALLGGSGSGKTTILRLIAGFLAPQRGRIEIDGLCVSEAGRIIVPPHQRGVSMVFQDLALWPHMSVAENIGFGLKMQGVAARERELRVEAMLERVSLGGYGDKRIDTLSGGEKQRVALARALILAPKILLMDEPLSSLDPALNRQLRQEILRLHHAMGFTLLYVTHSEAEAAEIGEREVRMPVMLK